MIVGFSKHGKGNARGAINYFTSAKNPDGTTRTPRPEILRGDPALVRRLIDSLDFTYKYTSGVLSFSPGEVITPEMEERIMDGFERAAFAGLDRDQYSILWVRHAHAGHHELNFLVARVELSTGKSLNIAPPGRASRELFDTFRSWVNAEYGLADPDDPSRSQDVSLPNHLAKLRASATRKGEQLKDDIRESITAFVRREVDAGRITDRDGVVKFLERQGFTIPRAGKDYITVLDPTTGDRLRLKGGLYNLDSFDPRQAAAEQVRYGVPDPDRAAELAEKLERLAAARARYHQQRYGRPGDTRTQQRTPDSPEPPRQGGERLEEYLHRNLGDDAIALEDDGQTPARSTQRRARRQRMQQAAEAIGRGEGDSPGTTVGDRRTAPGAAISRTRHRHHATLAGVDAAAQRLSAASQLISATGTSFAASLNEMIERLWWERFYGEMEPER